MQSPPPAPPAEAPAEAPAGAPAVVLFDELGAASAVPVAAAGDALYGVLQELTGYAELEPWMFVMSRGATTLAVALYVNEVGRYENSLNRAVSELLGVQLFGKAVFVCMEEFAGDENGEGAWSTVVSAEAMVRALAARGESLPEYGDNRLGGRVGDFMQEMRNTLAERRRRTDF